MARQPHRRSRNRRTGNVGQVPNPRLCYGGAVVWTEGTVSGVVSVQPNCRYARDPSTTSFQPELVMLDASLDPVAVVAVEINPTAEALMLLTKISGVQTDGVWLVIPALPPWALGEGQELLAPGRLHIAQA